MSKTKTRASAPKTLSTGEAVALVQAETERVLADRGGYTELLHFDVMADGNKIGQVYQTRESERSTYAGSRIGYDRYHTEWTHSEAGYGLATDGIKSRTAALADFVRRYEYSLPERQRRAAAQPVGYFVVSVNPFTGKTETERFAEDNEEGAQALSDSFALANVPAFVVPQRRS